MATFLYMAYDVDLADRVGTVLHDEHCSFVEKKMMGGLCFMVNGKMCVGIVKDSLMVRIDPQLHEASLQKLGCREMDFTGRPMKGFVFVSPEGIDNEDDLRYWVRLALDFNPQAKSSRKK